MRVSWTLLLSMLLLSSWMTPPLQVLRIIVICLLRWRLWKYLLDIDIIHLVPLWAFCWKHKSISSEDKGTTPMAKRVLSCLPCRTDHEKCVTNDSITWKTNECNSWNRSESSDLKETLCKILQEFQEWFFLTDKKEQEKKGLDSRGWTATNILPKQHTSHSFRSAKWFNSFLSRTGFREALCSFCHESTLSECIMQFLKVIMPCPEK